MTLIDLAGVRRGDAHLERAKQLLEGAQPRPVPLDTITTTNTEDTMPDKLVFTPDEAAELLGVHPQTVRQWIRDGDLGAAQMGRSYRIDRAQLERFWRARGGVALFGPPKSAPEAGRRTLAHYMGLFESADQVGRRLVAEAVYAGRYGGADHPDTDTLRDIVRQLPDTPIDAAEAIEMVRRMTEGAADE